MPKDKSIRREDRKDGGGTFKAGKVQRRRQQQEQWKSETNRLTQPTFHRGG